MSELESVQSSPSGRHTHAEGVGTRWSAGVPGHRHDRRLRQELAIRGSVCLLILIFHEVLGSGAENPLIRSTALLGLFLNGPYYLAARTGRWLHQQAYVRMCADIALVTLREDDPGGGR